MSNDNPYKITKQCPECQKAFTSYKLKKRKFCTQACASRSKSGENNNAWKGGAKPHHGYRRITVKKKLVIEHRHLMENHLGRKLNQFEVVHHINENKLDNRLENLQVMTRSDHTRYHATCSQWSRKYKNCILCKTTEIKHMSKGLCSYCYASWTWHGLIKNSFKPPKKQN